jgi:transcriptional regulator with XRE-family HTH domain
MAGIGARLHEIRKKWQLSLREVEERSVRLAKDRSNPSYQISAAWLNRLEREEHKLTVSTLFALSQIYNVPTDHLLRSTYSANDQPLIVSYLLRRPDETTLLLPHELENSSHLRAIVGKRDHTAEPMIPAGSIVRIDRRDCIVGVRRVWKHEFERPVYFLMTRNGYTCGWCELDEHSEWLTMIPHPLSSVPSRRWRYQREVECLGRVVAVAIRIAA